MGNGGALGGTVASKKAVEVVRAWAHAHYMDCELTQDGAVALAQALDRFAQEAVAEERRAIETEINEWLDNYSAPVYWGRGMIGRSNAEHRASALKRLKAWLEERTKEDA